MSPTSHPSSALQSFKQHLPHPKILLQIRVETGSGREVASWKAWFRNTAVLGAVMKKTSIETSGWGEMAGMENRAINAPRKVPDEEIDGRENIIRETPNVLLGSITASVSCPNPPFPLNGAPLSINILAILLAAFAEHTATPTQDMLRKAFALTAGEDDCGWEKDLQGSVWGSRAIELHSHARSVDRYAKLQEK
ncbi:hypothetical protein M427DRAFT_47050 [Gonapodya prolifera JEL478]|uniref:Uncharacterized protein n=1 Tax=Gonapodya prolifera (strain JEL478) TaxID=1344416 RepID=A0A139A3X4_GONPJ|nr:hypothetical protein M427DRAFT_47050 [Gonapodya prolifera JEL478]|eukprot:KXS11526.1 hypothetical protein M427DRAFT_47050 [Gonapodya prolifera JEL478]